MKILVTGGAGYIGSHTAKALQKKGYDVVVYDNLSTGHEWAVQDGGISGTYTADCGQRTAEAENRTADREVQNVECGEQRTEAENRNTDCGAQRTNGGSQRTNDGSQRTNGGSQRTNRQLAIGDISDSARLAQIFDEHHIDAVVHFAASSLVGESVSNPAKYYENNVIGSKRLFDVMLSKGVNKLVFSSTCATYGLPEAVPITEDEKQQPINTYGWTKLMIERIMQDYGQAYGLNSVALRYFNAAGSDYENGIGEAHSPESHVIPLLLETVMGKRQKFSLFGEDYDTKDGSCIRDYIHVRDLAAAHILALERLLGIGEELNLESVKSMQDVDGKRDSELAKPIPNPATTDLGIREQFECFNLGTGQGVSVLELIKTFEKITGKKVNTDICPRREGDPPILIADNKKATRQLGWLPVHSDIENIVESAYKWELLKSKSI